MNNIYVVVTVFHYSLVVTSEPMSVPDEFERSDESSEEQPQQKKPKASSPSKDKEEIGGDSFVCEIVGCPSKGKDFKTKDGYMRHVK